MDILITKYKNMEWYIKVLKKYAVFEGRAQRKEYWMFTLVNIIIIVILGIIEGMFHGGFNVMPNVDVNILAGIYNLAILIPSIAVAVRRLHDTDKSGWWMLLMFIPLIGMLLLLFFMIKDGQKESNRFGPNPKEPVVAPIVN